MSTPAEVLLHRIRRQCHLNGFKISLAARTADLYLQRGTRQLPTPVDAVAFATAVSGSTCDLVLVWVGTELVQRHQLVNDKRTWRSSTMEPAEEADAA
jgi:hypothetical protein